MPSATSLPLACTLRLGGLFLGLCLLVPLGSAAPSGSSPAQLLRDELPANVSLEKAPCELLARALFRAVQAHRGQATALLHTALSGNRPNGEAEPTRACACVRQLFRAALRADPKEASSLLEQTVSLYPACADELQREAAATNDKDVVFDSKAVAFDPGAGVNSDTATNPTNAPTGFDTPGDYYGGFGVGFGPGFPGSPGFTGSPPSGSITLPNQPTAITSVDNG